MHAGSGSITWGRRTRGMELKDQIQYWRSRAALAKRFGLARQAEAAEQIAAELRGLARHQAQVEAKVCRLRAAIPVEEFEVQ